MKHTEVRKRFLDFFRSKGHTVVPSDSLVPADDPTLLFTTAGMNQFKSEFLGNIKGFRRATTCQKCFRADDLEEVGKTAYHHTFFEMLGNFSFGGYFKKDAIAWAWEFMKDVLKIREEKMWVSVYKEDEEAYNIWRDKVGVPAAKIVRLGPKENFWPSEAKEKGPNGPCGPCSEIFFDYGDDVGCKRKDCSPACDCGRFVEVWNLVFTQFERKEGGVLEPLPNKNIDTGMGLERLCAVMQGVKSNFETDLFAPIVKVIEDELQTIASQPKPTRPELLYLSKAENIRRREKIVKNCKIYIDAIADHIRAVTFAISDGVAPSNEKRGYVIRKIINKASFHARDLDVEGPFLYKLVYSVGKVMEDTYPEILKKHVDIARVIKAEEERFASTIKSSLRILYGKITEIKNANKKVIPGETTFKLFDTHGLPLFLIKEVAAGKGLGVDEKEFDRLLDLQREQSRKSSQLHTDIFVDSGIRERTEFIGYDKCKARAKVLRILTEDGRDIDKVNKGDAKVILDKSVFYGESGGQVGDTGTIKTDKFEAEVINSTKIADAIVADINVKRGELKKGDMVDTAVDEKRRLAIAKNHTATHLLQAALRKVLGEHVRQQGSFVGDEYLRFDFSHFKALTNDELQRVEELVNEYIKEAHKLKTEEVSLENAKKKGALAFFGEKYEQKVRMVAIGDESKELCGGTHLKNTSQISLFKIIKEGSVASGIRRVEAVTADAADRWIQENKKQLQKKEKALKEKEKELRLARERLKNAGAGIDTIIKKGKDISGVNLIVTKIESANTDMLKRVSDIIKTKLNDFILFIVSADEGRVNFLLSISDSMQKRGLNAGKLIGEIAKLSGGSGGGRPNMALGGCKDVKRIELLLKEAENVLSKEIK